MTKEKNQEDYFLSLFDRQKRKKTDTTLKKPDRHAAVMKSVKRLLVNV